MAEVVYTTVIPGAGVVIPAGAGPITITGSLTVRADGDILIDTDITTSGNLTVANNSNTGTVGDITAVGVDLRTTSGFFHTLKVNAPGVVDVTGSNLVSAGGQITLASRNTIVGDFADIISCGGTGSGSTSARVTTGSFGTADGDEFADFSFVGANIRVEDTGFPNIALGTTITLALVDLTDATIGLSGGALGDLVAISGSTITVGGATILNPSGPSLTGTQAGTPASIGVGSLPCEEAAELPPSTGTITITKRLESPACPVALSDFCFTLTPDINGEVCADITTGEAVFDNLPLGPYTATETKKQAGWTDATGKGAADCGTLTLTTGGQ